ncbi:Hsp70 family protein [Paractinoplanes lichenicola]|uniref:Hsp70 family protein n=1 Tax=Paractinoplanes lichenicola TaxID=2802976 RepID=A0ABS1VS65_9ACTN|nr:Hsp70 family protein [Actinoplanes lichenicola]MBL7257508.1 Hsp70 family protein [Actinoplanes lichenicola]
MEWTYGLGIDLGTTQTAAAVHDDAGATGIVRLGGRRAEIPSLVFVKEDGSLLIGEAAERRGLAEPSRLAREFKRRMGDPVPILAGGTPFSAHALTGKLLRHVLDEVTRLRGGPPSALTLTHPANWGPYKREQFAQAVRLADAENVTYRTEPEAAALQHATARRIASGETVMVYDLGGGTFDVALLRRDGDGFTLVGEPEGIEQLGGADFDEAVFAHVVGALGDAAESLDADDPEVVAALSRLRRDCVEAKEALSFDTEAMITVALPGLHTRVRLNRSELESMISPALEDTLAATRRAMRSAGLDATQVSAILLAGGSSRIPVVAQLLGEEFGRPVIADPHPEHSIALGAAVASGPAASSQLTPPTTSPYAHPARTSEQPTTPYAQPAATHEQPTTPYAQPAPTADAPNPTRVMPAQPFSAPPQRSGDGVPVFQRGAASVPSGEPEPLSATRPFPAGPEPLAPTAAFAAGAETPAPTYPADQRSPSHPADQRPPAFPPGPAAGHLPLTNTTPFPASPAAPGYAGTNMAPPSAPVAALKSGTAERGTPPVWDDRNSYGKGKPTDLEAPRSRPSTRRLALAAGMAVVLVVGGVAGAVAWNKRDKGDGETAAPPPSAPVTSTTPKPPYPTDASILVRVDTGGDDSASRVSKIVSFKPGIGTERTAFPSTEPGDLLPRWSHNRELIAMTHTNADNTNDIVIMNKEGTSRHTLVEDVANSRATWSGDDKLVAYMKKVDGFNQIFRISIDGGEPEQLTFSKEAKDDPFYTVDSEAIVYWVFRADQKLIYVLNAKKLEEPGRRITQPKLGPAVDPALAPDDSYILFTLESPDGNSDIWIVDKLTKKPPRRLTTSPEREMDPTWSPDGKWFAFTRGDYDKPQIVIMKPDGTGETVLTAPGQREGHPCWF